MNVGPSPLSGRNFFPWPFSVSLFLLFKEIQLQSVPTASTTMKGSIGEQSLESRVPLFTQFLTLGKLFNVQVPRFP